MPCWTVQTTKINLANADEKLLRDTLAALGFTNIHTNAYGAKLTADRFSDRTSVKLMPDGSVQVTAADRRTDLAGVGREISRGYSEQVVRSTAKRFGWTLTEEGPGKFQVQRRGM